jgi:hypothetical protein
MRTARITGGGVHARIAHVAATPSKAPTTRWVIFTGKGSIGRWVRSATVSTIHTK